MEVECLCKCSVLELKVRLGIIKGKGFSNSQGYFLANNFDIYQPFVLVKLDH